MTTIYLLSATIIFLITFHIISINKIKKEKKKEIENLENIVATLKNSTAKYEHCEALNEDMNKLLISYQNCSFDIELSEKTPERIKKSFNHHLGRIQNTIEAISNTRIDNYGYYKNINDLSKGDFKKINMKINEIILKHNQLRKESEDNKNFIFEHYEKEKLALSNLILEISELEISNEQKQKIIYIVENFGKNFKEIKEKMLIK